MKPLKKKSRLEKTLQDHLKHRPDIVVYLLNTSLNPRKAAGSEKPMELSKLVKQCTDILKNGSFAALNPGLFLRWSWWSLKSIQDHRRNRKKP